MEHNTGINAAILIGIDPWSPDINKINYYYVLQSQHAIRWHLVNQYGLEQIAICKSMAVAPTGEVAVFVLTQSHKSEVRWYSKEGKRLRTLPYPAKCKHEGVVEDHSVLVVDLYEGAQPVGLSCDKCQCIWLQSPGKGTFGKLLRKVTGEWYVAWEASGEEYSEERELQPKPSMLCQGKPGQIIAVNGEPWISVSVFDTTRIPFGVVQPKLVLDMEARNLCYCELPGVGDALAVTDHNNGGKLGMFGLESGKLLWSVGGPDTSKPIVERFGRKTYTTYPPLKVAGSEWTPTGICCDYRGRLYVADQTEGNPRIIVFSTASGSILQEFKHFGLGIPRYLCWNESTKSIIVGTLQGSISYYKIDC